MAMLKAKTKFSSPLSTLIADVHFDFALIESKFSIYQLSYRNFIGQDWQEKAPYLARRIYQQGHVLALSQHWQEKCYWILTSKEHSFDLLDQDLAVKQVSLNALPKMQIARLLVKAIKPLLQEKITEDGIHRYESDGLYYLSKINPSKSEDTGFEIIMLAIDLESTPAIDDRCRLTLKTVSFTPLEWHKNKEGAYPAKILKKTRYQFDEFGLSLNKKISGDYIRKSKYAKSKNRITAVNFKEESFDKFRTSKAGLLDVFMQDLARCYEKSVCIELEHLPSAQHKLISDAQVDKYYQKLMELVKTIPLQIFNHSSNKEAGEKLSFVLQQLNVEADLAKIPHQNAINLLIVDEAEKYESVESDPYHIVKRQYPDCVFQACHPANLDKKTVLEVLLKELLIKYESKHGQLLFDYPQNLAGVHYYLPVRPEGKIEDIKNIAWSVYKLQFDKNDLTKFSCELACDDEILDIKMGMDIDDQKYVFKGAERHGFIYWQEIDEYAIFVDTQVQLLPEYQDLADALEKLEQGRGKEIPRTLLENFVEKNPNSSVKEFLVNLLVTKDCFDEIHFDDFKALNYKSNDQKAFYNYLTDHGHALKSSIRNQSDVGFFSGVVGFYFDHKNGFYYAGTKGGVETEIENFCRLYRVIHSFDELPQGIAELFDVYHLRHRSTTVTPYPFKHLKEYINQVF